MRPIIIESDDLGWTIVMAVIVGFAAGYGIAWLF